MLLYHIWRKNFTTISAELTNGRTSWKSFVYFPNFRGKAAVSEIVEFRAWNPVQSLSFERKSPSASRATSQFSNCARFQSYLSRAFPNFPSLFEHSGKKHETRCQRLFFRHTHLYSFLRILLALLYIFIIFLTDCHRSSAAFLSYFLHRCVWDSIAMFGISETTNAEY